MRANFRKELGDVISWGDRHRVLIARLSVVLLLTLIIDFIGTILMYFMERHAKGTEITSVGDAAFFTTVQLLTVSSQIKNPFTTGGRIVDVGLEIWAVVVVAGSAGAIANFFATAE